MCVKITERSKLLVGICILLVNGDYFKSQNSKRKGVQHKQEEKISQDKTRTPARKQTNPAKRNRNKAGSKYWVRLLGFVFSFGAFLSIQSKHKDMNISNFTCTTVLITTVNQCSLPQETKEKK